MTTETVLTNATLVLPDALLQGTLVMRDGLIADIQPGNSQAPGAVNLEGDHLIPGIVDLHTDNLERQVQPRASARWPGLSAMVTHDAQTAASGVTTVLDALCCGDLGFDPGRVQTFREGVANLDALAATGLLKSDHWLHLRCELPAPDMREAVEPVVEHPLVRMISLMDHSPGVGQYRDVERYRAFRQKQLNLPEAEMDALLVRLQAQRLERSGPNRRWLLDLFAGRDLPLASHDDDTVEVIAENIRDGITISEFPVVMETAQAARAAGMTVIAGAPNLVRGGSHNGNVSAADLVQAGAMDAFASDYVPAALIEAAWHAPECAGVSLPEAVAMVTDRPARMAHFTDRGRLEAGLRADLVRVRSTPLGGRNLPVIRTVWRAGERVA